MANGRVERAFSAMNIIKTDHRNCLGEDHLDDLMRIAIDGPPLSQWDATGAIKLWWKDKQRRCVLDHRTTPRPSTSASIDVNMDNDSDDDFDLADWKSFLYS